VGFHFICVLSHFCFALAPVLNYNSMKKFSVWPGGTSLYRQSLCASEDSWK
jgi:hypothetical protein